MSAIEVEVGIYDGDGNQIEIIGLDMDLEKLSMRESVTLERTLGSEAFDALMNGQAALRPSLIQAIVFAKLKTRRPTVTVDDFDFDLQALWEAFEGVDPPNPPQSG